MGFAFKIEFLLLISIHPVSSSHIDAGTILAASCIDVVCATVLALCLCYSKGTFLAISCSFCFVSSSFTLYRNMG